MFVSQMQRIPQGRLWRCSSAFRMQPQGSLRLQRSSTQLGVTCMAHPRRVARVSKQLEREVGQLFLFDKVLQQAICPEQKQGMDSAISAIASVTEVRISNDLQVAKVYVSIYSDDEGKAQAMDGLKRLEGYVRKHIGTVMRLRLTPEVRFVLDDSLERSERVMKLLDQIQKSQTGEAALEPPPIVLSEPGEGVENDDDDLEDFDFLDDDDTEDGFLDLEAEDPNDLVIEAFLAQESAQQQKPVRSGSRSKGRSTAKRRR